MVSISYQETENGRSFIAFGANDTGGVTHLNICRSKYGCKITSAGRPLSSTAIRINKSFARLNLAVLCRRVLILNGLEF